MHDCRCICQSTDSQAKCRCAIRKYSSRIQRTCRRVSKRRVMSLMYRGITLTDRETRRDEMRWLVPWCCSHHHALCTHQCTQHTAPCHPPGKFTIRDIRRRNGTTHEDWRAGGLEYR